MTPTELADALTRTGFKKPGVSLPDALTEYQNWHGLDSADATVTERHLKLERFCGFPDKMPLGATIPKWTKRKLRYCIVNDLPNIPRADYRQVVAEAWSYITRYINLDAEEIDNPNSADVLIKTFNGQPFGVLAQAELPYPPDRRRDLEADSTERWIISSNPPQGYIVLLIVLIHELLHIVGLFHTNVPNQIMNPTYNPRIGVPQKEWDIPQIVALYGARATPLPPPTGGLTEDIVIGTRKGKITWAA